MCCLTCQPTLPSIASSYILIDVSTFIHSRNTTFDEENKQLNVEKNLNDQSMRLLFDKAGLFGLQTDLMKIRANAHIVFRIWIMICCGNLIRCFSE